MTQSLPAARPRRLKELVPSEVTAVLGRDPRLIIPLGACESHGPHMPLGCDSIIIDQLADDLSAEFGVLRAPLIEYGGGPQRQDAGPGPAAWRRGRQTPLGA